MTDHLNYRHDTRVFGGIWQAIIGFSAPWAHPLWNEYVVLAYDLNEPHEGAAPFKMHPTATHEFLLHALDASRPLDYSHDMFDQNFVYLQPANHGYQIVAATNEAALQRLIATATECVAMRLSPDTDFTALWDQRFLDGWTLKNLRPFSKPH